MRRNYPYVLQENVYDCGIASLMTCFLCKNITIKKDDVLEYLHDKKEGITALDLINTSNKLGLLAKGVKCKLNVLKKEFLPVIAHTIIDNSYHHYMVILDLDEVKETLLVLDPQSGIKKMKYQEFEKISTNVFILFENKKGNKSNLFQKYLKKIFRIHKKKIIQCFTISILLLFILLIYQYWLNIIMTILESKSISYLVTFIIIFTLIIIFKSTFEFIQNKFIIKLEHRLDKSIHEEVTSHLINLPYTYFSYRTTGELVTNVNDIENFKNIVIDIFITCFLNIFIMILILIVMIRYHILFSICLLFFTIITILITKSYSKRLKDDFYPLKQRKLSYNSNLISMITTYPTIKGLSIENEIYNKNKHYYKKYLKYNYLYYSSREKYNLLISSITNLFLIISIIFITILIINNYIDLYFIILYYNFFNIYTNILTKVLNTILLYPVYQESVRKVLEVLDTKMIDKDIKPSKFKTIKIDNLSYSIDNNKILDKVNFTIHTKDRILLRGKSGSGKSTLIKLIMGYLRKEDGNILYDDIKQENINISTIKDNIVYVSQEEKLYTDTLYQNLSIKNSKLKDIEKAVKNCHLEEIFKDNKIDYNYMILEDGSNLSGGERNRIKIARALTIAKNFVILDESLNGLDKSAERRILSDIFNNYKKITFVVISHKNTNLDLYNKVFDLDKEELKCVS